MELYVHIPFCVRKCRYCDFVSFAANEEMKTRYINALIKELGNYSGLLKGMSGFDTVFIGGGTPSVLDTEQTGKLLRAIAPLLNKDTEFTIECNPGTLDEEKLGIYRAFGVNRLSLGLQSADDKELGELGRIHTYNDFLKTFETAKSAGFTNINVDLMSGLPGQTVSGFEKTLRTVAGLGSAHISAYSLIIEPGTPFFELYGENGSKKELLPTEDEDREIYHRTEEVLGEYGYHRYEISNYSKDGMECRHNLGYWKGEEYLGIGLNAASYIDHTRYKNTEDILSYIDCIESGDFEKLESLRTDIENIGENERIEEYIILHLRLTEGIDLKDFEKRFGSAIMDRYHDKIEKNIALGLLKIEKGRLFLTRKGLDLANSVMIDFMD